MREQERATDDQMFNIKHKEREMIDGKPKEQQAYPCLFDLTDSCPVRKHYKLAPEHLQPFCLICPLRQVQLAVERHKIMHSKVDKN